MYLKQLTTTKSGLEAFDLLSSLLSEKPAKQAEQVNIPNTDFTSQEQAILDKMGTEPMHIDALATVTAIDISSLLVHLFELELKTGITQQPGQLFQRKKRLN